VSRWRRATARARRYLSHAYVDLRLWATGKADPEAPPLRKTFVGQGDFRATGRHLAELLVRLGGLEPGHRVLDIGCGIGRVALALTEVLGPEGCYEGFDVVRSGVGWCTKHIAARHPNFRFTLAEVYNREYNRRGRPAIEYRFPYAGGSFDLAFATSVFTHLAVEETAHYLAEAARVLKPGGCLVASFFLVNERFRPERLVRGYDFPVDRGDHRLADAHNPAAAIALGEGPAREMIARTGLRLIEPIHFGTWCGGRGPSFQDFVVAERPRASEHSRRGRRRLRPTALA
jgi:SAM-dependent methyltransferase